MSDLVVVNSSPIILLSRIGKLELLRLLGEKIHVTQEVVSEIQVYSDEVTKALHQAPWLIRVPDEEMPEAVRSWDLGRGESSVLAWASSRASTLAPLPRSLLRP